MPFSPEERDGVLWLTLETPGASVNIFNSATAKQTLELMRQVDPGRVRAVVIRSAKATSFINGAGVLLVTYVKTPEDVAAESLPYREAYAAVRACPVPTVAAIQGSCWGCGLELALQCDHRIAADDHGTQFRLTEMSDYVEVPLFGSTRFLAPVVGMRKAIDLLLWDDRWGARRALEEGLIQEVAAPAMFPEAVEAFVRRVVRGDVPSQKTAPPRLGPDPLAVIAEARKKVESIPPLYHRTFGDTLDLLELAARGEVGEEHARRGLLATTASTTHPNAKAAYGMFHLRQTAATLAMWGAQAEEHAIALGGEGPGVLRFFEELRKRQPLAGVRVLAAPPADLIRAPVAHAPNSPGAHAPNSPGAHAPNSPGAHAPNSPGAHAPNSPGAHAPNPPGAHAPNPPGAHAPTLTILVGPNDARGAEDVEVSPPLFPPPDSGADSLCWPIPGGPFVELHAARGARSGLAHALQRAGFQVALSRGDAYGSHQLLGAALAALASMLLDGETPHTVDRALRELGLFRRAPALLSSLRPLGAYAAVALAGRAFGGQAPQGLAPALAQLEAPADFRAGRDAPGLIDEFLLWLLPVALDGSFQHPSFVDLAARELLDFPVARLSLCAHLTPDRVRRALEGVPARLPARARARAEAYAGAGKGFYR
ncbi:MAG TPA: enoyl-CoA hydratase-related protein [Myxococcaceae bacterium]|nr:enoyl-CoA hydratase-related protein [Myxococcaceae bacterium]